MFATVLRWSVFVFACSSCQLKLGALFSMKMEFLFFLSIETCQFNLLSLRHKVTLNLSKRVLTRDVSRLLMWLQHIYTKRSYYSSCFCGCVILCFCLMSRITPHQSTFAQHYFLSAALRSISQSADGVKGSFTSFQL